MGLPELLIKEDTSMDEKCEWLYDELYGTYRKRVKTKHLTKEAYLFDREVGKFISEAATNLINLTWDVDGYFSFFVHHPRRNINAPLEQEHRLKAISEGVKKGTISIPDARRSQEGIFEYLSHGTESQDLIGYMYRTYPIP